MFPRYIGDRLKFCGLLSISIQLLPIIQLCQARLFEGCDHVYQINAGETYLESPYYPQNYPPFTSCRYKFVAPLDYGIQAECRLNIPKNPTSCSTQHFYVARDGDPNLRNSEEFCGFGSFQRQSLFRTLSLAYESRGGTGNFTCRLYAAPRPCDCGWSINTRISNGVDAQLNEYPSAVALRDRASNLPSFCGASILSHYFLLTAAHCTHLFRDPRYIVALVGDHDLTNETESRFAAQYDIIQIIEHPDYTNSPVTNDIAILRTSQPIEWSRGVGPICLPPLSQRNNNFAYQSADVIGWGLTRPGGARSPVLQKVQLVVTENTACAQAYSDIGPIIRSQMCTIGSMGRDSCEYDSGGPVILRKARQFLIGCISFGKACGVGSVSVGVNTRITPFLNWIYQSTQYTTCTVEFN